MSIRPESSRNLHAHLEASAETGPPVIAATMAESTRPRYFWVIGFAALVVAALMATRASGQAKFPFDSIEMHPSLQDETRVKQIHAVAKQFANSGQGSPASVNGYFAYYVPAKMTAPDGVKHISELMEEATTLLSRAELSNRGNVVRTLTQYLFDGMKKVAEGNHHPAARINAILMLSRLNSRPANLMTKAPPIPRADVLPILLTIYQDENNVDGVRAAALTGIHRQTVFGFPQIQQSHDAIRQLATDLLDSPAPAGRSEKAHAYLQRYAVDMLDVLKPSDDKQLATKLVSISTTPENPDLIALYAAERLASMSADLQGQVETPEDLLNSWTKRVLQAYESEVARVEGLERTMPSVTQPPKPESFLETPKEQPSPTNTASMVGGMTEESSMSGMMDISSMMMEGESGQSEQMSMMGLSGMMPGASAEAAPQPPEVRVSRKKLNLVLQQVHLAVTGKASVGKPKTPAGLLAAVSDEKKAEIESWIEKMEPIVTELNEPQLDSREKWVEKLKEQVETLTEMVGEDADPKQDDADDQDAADAGFPDDVQPEEPVNPADELGLAEEIGG